MKQDQHAKASPSDYRRWSTCAGSLTLQKKLGRLLPEDTAGPAAELGTELHAIAERILTGDMFAESPPESIVPYIDYCQSLKGEKHVEVKVPLFYSPSETGTADYVCISDNGETVEITDLKTGSIPVYAEGNLQLLIYGLGAVNSLAPNAKRLKLTVHQFGEAYSWEIGMGKAKGLADSLGAAALDALDDNVTTLVPSDTACVFCRCKAYCKAYSSKIVESFDDIKKVIKMERLSDAKMAELFSKSADIRKALKSIEDALYSRVSNGEEIAGLSISNSRKGNKIWSSDVDPISVMCAAGIEPNDAIISKPITPSQALKLAKDITGWEQPDGKARLTSNDTLDVDEWFEEI